MNLRKYNLTFALLFGVAAYGKQHEPDRRRTLEIQQALVNYGRPVHVNGKWDPETKAALAGIAQEHCWQIAHVPDARVLRLLGFKSPAYDPQLPDPATQAPGRLEYPPSCPGTGSDIP
jgi:hypothetical protein